MKRATWVGLLMLAPGAVLAQEVPDIVIEAPDVDVGETAVTDEIDLGNVVLSASKAKTTIQEAPAIVSVVTADEIKDHGVRTLNDVLVRIPGWMEYGALHHQFEFPLVRGTMQATLILHDGVSAFDPFANSATIHRVLPMEFYKRVETITGPGGVLWGANSYLGIVNMITKDVEDIRGVEASAGYGDGPGDRQVFKAYVMGGYSLLKSKKLKVVAHASYEDYAGPQYQMPSHAYSGRLPQPSSPYLYGPVRETDYPRSHIAQVNGKVSYGPISAYWHVPFFFERNLPLGFGGNVVRQDPPGDPAVDDGGGGLDCAPGSRPEVDGECYDPLGRSRVNRISFYDRYAILEYRGAFNQNKIQLNAKGYFSNFVREFKQLQILPASSLLRGGLAFTANPSAYRTGTSADANVALGKKVSLITGGEAFYEWLPESTARFNGPNDLARLPLPCPREVDPNNPGSSRIITEYDAMGNRLPGLNGCPLTFAFGADRFVIAGFANAQVRPTSGLVLDGGARVQVAPGGDKLPSTVADGSLHRRGYPAQLLVSGAAVWNFRENYHMKLNYAEGFRPPVFNNLQGNGEAVQIGGSPTLDVERSQSMQGEINARVLRNRRSVRDLSLRLDYSFTRLENLIQITNGAYANTGTRNIHSGEFLAKLNLVGGHTMEMGYTYLRTIMEDKGLFRGTPEHWFFLGTLIDAGKWADVNSTLRVMGAFEDPNRLVDQTLYNETQKSAIVVQPTDLVFDRIASRAELQVGLRLKNLTKGLVIKADLYNALDARSANGDYFYDLTPRLEITPNPTERFRFFASAQYHY